MPPEVTVSDEDVVDPKAAATPTGPTISVVDEADHAAGPSPEDAVAAANQRAEQFQRERDAERQRAATAEQQAAQARQSQQQDQVAVLASAVEAANAEAIAARGKLRQAKEMGDFDAEAQAYDDMASARARHDRASVELEMAKQRAPQRHASQTQPANNGGITPATQAWINAHPKFHEPATRDAMLAVHGQLLADGVTAESRAYFRALDTEYARLTASGDDTTMDNRGNGRATPASSSAAPPSRGSTGGTGSEVRTLMGPVRVTERNGQVNITIPPHLRADFDEGAKLCGMTTGAYAYEQVQIARERMNGGNGGLITEEGRSFR